jgi:predicted DsbA family dithiol-disulfide isomerase
MGGKTGLDAVEIGKCVDGTEGSKLLEASRKRASESGVTSGATFVVNERATIRTIHADALKQAVCTANPKLAGCDASLSSVLLK